MRDAVVMKALRGLPALLRYTTSLFPNRPTMKRGFLEGLWLNIDRSAHRCYSDPHKADDVCGLRHFGTRSGRRDGKRLYIEQNKKIAEFERNKDWRGLLDYAVGKSAGFDHVNWATTFSKLGRFRREARNIARDLRFRELLVGLEERIQEGDFGPQAIGNIVHALSKMGVRSDAVVCYVEDEVERIAAEADPQAISNISYAFAKLGEKGPTRWFEELEKKHVVDSLVWKGKPQEIANTIWARATRGLKGASLASAIDTKEVAEYVVTEGKPQEISNTVWSLATIGVDAGNLASAVDRKDVVHKLVEGKPQDVSNTVWAMSTMKVECPGLVNGIKCDAGSIMKNGNSQAVGNIAYALADLGYFEKGVFDAVAGQAKRIAAEGNEQDLCNLLWSLAVAGRMKENERAVEVLWKEVNRRDEGRFLKVHWRQLKIASLFAGCEGMKLEAGEAHQRKMDEAALHVSSGSERFEKDIAKELERSGFKGFRREMSPFAGSEGGELLKIDIAFEKERVALELDGPFHFLKFLKKKGEGEKPRRDGSTKAKTRLLESLGWEVTRLGYLNNRKLKKLPGKKRREFWVKKLGKLGVEPTRVLRGALRGGGPDLPRRGQPPPRHHRGEPRWD